MTVLDHEMAHGTSRHSAERLFRSEITQTILGGVKGSISQMDLRQRQTLMAALGAGVTLSFSREQESESDHIGLLYMTHAGYDPKEATAFWQKMDEHVGNGSPPGFLSSHPSHHTRIARLQTWMPETQKEFTSQYNHTPIA